MFKLSKRNIFGNKGSDRKVASRSSNSIITNCEETDTDTDTDNMPQRNKHQEEADAKLAQKLNQEEADEEYARKLLEQEMISGINEHSTATASSTLAAPRSNRRNLNSTGNTTRNLNVANCPGRHGLTLFMVSRAQRVGCDQCHRRLDEDEDVYSCVICNYDICSSCYRNPREINRPSQAPTQPQPSPPITQNSASSPFPFPIPSFEPPTHMCLVPCEIGKGVCVEMMVDTGAQSSVISYSLAQKLNLTNRLDRSHQGVAAGVGKARIMGKLRNISCIMGHVEFAMDFIVLDVQDQLLLLLGLDQMRKYKCIVDLERNLLIFGGIGGVEVTLLPAGQAQMDIRNSLAGCPIM